MIRISLISGSEVLIQYILECQSKHGGNPEGNARTQTEKQNDG